MIWPLAKGWIIGYLLAGPQRDLVVEAEVAFIMAVWRLTEAIRRLSPTVAETAAVMADFSVAYREAIADEPTSEIQA